MYWKENFDEMDFAHTDNQHNQCMHHIPARESLPELHQLLWVGLPVQFPHFRKQDLMSSPAQLYQLYYPNH